MHDLETLQAEFLLSISQEKGAVVDTVMSTPALDSEARLKIYRHAYFARLKQVLAQDYPALATMLGDTAFDQLCAAYIKKNPSDNTSIRWFGEKMPGFLAITTPYCKHGVLAEIAEWERLLRKIFDAANAQPLTLAQLQSLPAEQWPELRLVLIPASIEVSLRFNTVALWKTLKDTQAPPALETLPAAASWLLWRVDWVTQYRSLPDDEQIALSAVRNGATFAEICEQLWDIHEEQAPARAGALLQGWVTSQLVSCETFNGAAHLPSS